MTAPGAAPAIRLRGLCTLFGPAPARHLQRVRDGIGKDELRDRHGHVLALRDLTLDMPAGQIQVVMGLSGSGKSTLLRHINRLIEPTAGQVLVGPAGHETDVLALSAADLRQFRRTQAAMVFQRFALFPHLTVLDNVRFGLQVRAMPEAAGLAEARRWIGRVGLAGYEQHYPRQLSGGMQQRVGLARALAGDTPLLLMDEPFSALDPLIRRDLQSMLLALQQEMGKTVVFITHDLDEALRLGDRIAILRDGALVQQGSGPEIVLAPADAGVADFVKDVNRARVLRCRHLLAAPTGQPASDSPPGRDGLGTSAARPGQETVPGQLPGPTLQADTRLDEAARLLLGSAADAAPVVDAQGRHLGVLGLREILGAIVPAAHGPADGDWAGIRAHSGLRPPAGDQSSGV